MAYNQRVESILTIISKKRSVTVQELKERLKVSEVTIRKDLDVLEGEGVIFRTHGGATLAEDRGRIRAIGTRESINVEEKRAIAALAKTLVEEGDTIYIDAGSTCRLFASAIKDMSIQVVTNSLDVLNELADADNIALHSPGGSFRRTGRVFIGPQSTTMLADINIKTCFLGASGFDKEGVFSSQNIVEAHLKRQAYSVSERCVVLTDTSKFGISAFSVFARPNDVDIVVTDWNFCNTSTLLNLDIEVMVAPRPIFSHDA